MIEDSEDLPAWEREEDPDLEASVNEALKGARLEDELSRHIRDIIQRDLPSFDANREVDGYYRMREEQPEAAVYIESGIRAFWAENYDEVLEFLCAIEKPSSFVTFLIADSEASLGHFEKAIGVYGKILADNPKNVDALLATACAYYNLDDAEKQLDFLNRALVLDENRQIGWRARGFVYLSRGELENSHKDFSRALYLDPEDWEAHLGLARVYHQQEKIGEAMKHYDACLEHITDAPVVLYYRACAHFDEGRLEDALADLDAAWACGNNDPGILVKMGDIHHVEGRYQDAALCYRRAIPLFEDEENKCDILQSLGYVLINDDKPADAIAIASELFHLGDMTKGFLLRGDVRLKMGDVKGAENDCNLARASDRESGMAIYLMQRILTERGRVREAQKYQAELDKLLAA